LIVYTQRKKRRKDIVVAESGLDAPVSEVLRGNISFANKSLVKKLFGGRVGSSSPPTRSYGNLEKGPNWVLIVF